MSKALETSELAQLLVRLEQAVAETSGRFKVQMGVVAGFFVVMGLLMGLQGLWPVSAFIWAFAAFIAFIGVRAGKKTAPDKMQPVVDAVRDDPARIKLVRHYETSDSMRMFVVHWIELKTADHRLVIKAPDWEQLYGYLRRRCPDAAFS